MGTWYIKLRCYETTGYFTGIRLMSDHREVGVHPNRSRAQKFESKYKAINMAKGLKSAFKCIISYEVVEE